MTYPDIFNRCIKVILKNEGGYVNHPNDPGGETNYGIAKKFYPYLDIKNITKEIAIEIYYKDYWTPMNLNYIINADLILHVFDFGVNAGRKTAIRLLQRLVKVEDDGIIGNDTLLAVNNYNESIVEKYKRRRKIFYMNLAARKPELNVFLNGWLKRVDRTKF
jgi:lysozyme family protein